MAAPHSKHKRQRDPRGTHAQMRAQDPRVQRAAQATRAHQAALEARIEEEQRLSLEQARTRLRELTDTSHAPVKGSVKTIAASIEKRGRELVDLQREVKLREEQAAKRAKWDLRQARHMYRQGYTLEHCVERTGWPAEALADARMIDIVANEESFPCEECGKDLIDCKPGSDGVLVCPRCGHKEAI